MSRCNKPFENQVLELYDRNVVVCFLAGRAVTQTTFSLQHSSILQNVARTHTCRCGRSYKQISSLNRHMRYECGQTDKNQECHLCGRKYYRPDTLQEHLQSCLAKFRERNGCWVCVGLVNGCAVNVSEEETKHVLCQLWWAFWMKYYEMTGLMWVVFTF